MIASMLPVLELLQLTWTIFRRNTGLYVGYSAWLLIPAALVFVVSTLSPEASLGLGIIGQIIMIILGIWIWIVLISITAKIVAREKIQMEEISRHAWNRLLPLIGVVIMVGLVQLVGFLLLIIPGVVFMVWYAFAQTDVVLSERGGLAAMAESRQMVRGRFWPILWRLLAGPIVLGTIYAVGAAASISLIEYLGTGTVTLFSDSPSLSVNLLGTVADVLVMPLFIIYLTLLYLDAKQTLKKNKT